MDIYTYIKKDHKKVNQLFKKVIAAETMALKLSIFEFIYKELTLHAESEQKTFYKALDKTKKSKEEAEHAIEEHKEIKDILRKLKKPKINDELWLIHFGELKSIVEHHVKEEETEIFPIAQ